MGDPVRKQKLFGSVLDSNTRSRASQTSPPGQENDSDSL